MNRSLARYILVGSIAFFVDTASFISLLAVGFYRPLAASAAFLLGILCHFNLNRWFSFKNFDRAIHQQIRTYIVVATTCLLLTVTIIEVMVEWVRVSPLVAKITAVAINFPVSFLGHKYLSFGQGIRKTIKKITDT